MFRIIIIFIIITPIFSFGSTLTLYPQFSTNHYSSGSVLHTSKSGSSSLTALGLGGEKTYKNWIISGVFKFTIADNIEPASTFINPDLSLEYYTGFKDSDQMWFESSNLLIRHKSESFTFDFGKFDRHWGNGNRSLILSANTPSYPQFGFSWQISKKINLEYFNGFLSSKISDTTSTLYENVRGRDLFYPRSVSGHKLSYHIIPGLTFNAMEIVIYGGRSIEMHYLLPFIPFWSLQHYVGDIDNVQMCGELIWRIHNKTKLYGSLFMDEWTPEWTFDENNRNWFGYQIGGIGKDVIKQKDQLRIEYTWTDHRIYRHRFPINDSYSYNYSLGFWVGPHGEEIYLSYELPFKKINITSSISHIQRGELTDQMLIDQYDNIINKRYSGETENRTVASFICKKGILSDKVFLRFGCEWIDWRNPGFNPTTPEFKSDDFSKFSLYLGLTAKTPIIFD